MTIDTLAMQLMRIALGVLAAIFSLVVHELGHLAAGLAVGFRFHLFALGPLLIERDPRGRVRLAWNRDPGLFGGAAGTVPRNMEGLRRRFAVVVVGGPIASLVLALVAAAALALFPTPGGLLAMELKWIRLLSAAVFVMNAIPMANGPFVTDGLRLLRVLGRGPSADRELSLLALTALQVGGVRPRDWDRKLVDRGLAVRDASMYECQFHLWSYLCSLDSGHVAEAGDALDRAVALGRRAPASLRAQCLLESAFFEAAHRGRLEIARAALAAVPRRAAGVSESDRLRAEAAISMAEARSREAAELTEPALGPRPGRR